MFGRREIGILFLLAIQPGIAAGAEFAIRPGQKGNRVEFESQAPLEAVVGRTDRVSGTVSFDPDDLAGDVEVRIEVDLGSLDTGIGLRNKHMRENHLETDRYPVAVFRGGKILWAGSPRLEGGAPVEIRLAGELDLHGVVRPVEVQVELSLGKDGALQVATGFEVLLSDHRIKRPRFLVMRLAEEQRIRVQLRLRPVVPGGEG